MKNFGDMFSTEQETSEKDKPSPIAQSVVFRT